MSQSELPRGPEGWAEQAEGDLDEFFHMLDGYPRDCWLHVAQGWDAWHDLEDRSVKRQWTLPENTLPGGRDMQHAAPALHLAERSCALNGPTMLLGGGFGSTDNH